MLGFQAKQELRIEELVFVYSLTEPETSAQLSYKQTL